MKNLFKSLVATFMMIMTLSTSAFATGNNTTAQELQKQLRAIGVPEKYIGNTVEYLQKIKITDAEEKTIISNLEKIQGIIGSEKDITNISTDKKNEIITITKDTAKSLGLNITFVKSNNGKLTEAVITDNNGKKIMLLSTKDVEQILNKADITDIKEAIESAVDFSNNPDKNNFDAITGKPNKTATGYGNVMALALALIAGAGAFFFVGKKKLA